MAYDPQGFLKHARVDTPKRPAAERVRDWQPIYLRARDEVVSEQAARCMDCGVAFCHGGCPLGNLIPEWNEFVARGDWLTASERLHATNNFPEFTGWICPAPCEAACVLALNTDPVTIKQVEVSIVEKAFDDGLVEPQPAADRTGTRVAVVGSGPAGLAVAQQLTRAGHAVTVFERDDRIGGLLRYGIPDFKMPKHLIDRRIAQMAAEGTEFRVNCDVGPADVMALRSDYDAVVLAVGALAPREVSMPGRDLPGVHQAMTYLPQGNRVHAGDLAAAADRRGGQARDHRRWRRHRRRLPRHREPPGCGVCDGARPQPAPGAAFGPDQPGVAVGARAAAARLPPTTRASTRRGRVRSSLSCPMTAVMCGRRSSRRSRSFGSRGAASSVRWQVRRPSCRPTSSCSPQGSSAPTCRSCSTRSAPTGWPGGARSTSTTGGRPRSSGVYACGDAARGASLVVWAIAEGRACAAAVDDALTGLSELPRPVRPHALAL